ncbi:MAG: DEXDc helicase [Gaeavirus sp.]|uniref:DEXDc helicase n=1 Tax=Gaeavirus sp. TaxID=2487767 RepID=A0A3G4ZZC5_9VIRU|nr:MAG: DEXDc helicase [Gaeavirus sp.]
MNNNQAEESEATELAALEAAELAALEDIINNINGPNLEIINSITPSTEQTTIINSQTNAIIDAVAGSGKTTTILHMAYKYPKARMIQITYNSMLKHEVRKKVRSTRLTNLTVHTYHSLAVSYYDPSSYTDEGIKQILIRNKPCKLNTPFDIILIDETQDMMTDYFLLIKKFIYDTHSTPIIYIFGDRFQGIYEFKGANSKFLTLAQKLWNIPFKNLTMSTSYRLTNQISWFINNCMLNYTRIKTIKNGPKVDYHICNPYEIYKTIGKQILHLIYTEKHKPEDIFILVPSIKSTNPPYKKLENYLVSKKLKCMTPISDDAKLDDKIINDKIVFTTLHQSKGRERKIVIIYNFDSSYFTYYLKDEDKSKCPNILYVGATRAIHKLILIRDSKYEPLQFLNMTQPTLSNYVTIHQHDTKQSTTLTETTNDYDHRTSVTDLIKFIKSSTLEHIIILLENLFTTISQPQNIIPVPHRIKTSEDNGKVSYEDVSDLNGLVIPSIYEKLKTRISTIEEYVLDHTTDYSEIKKYIKTLTVPCLKLSDFLKIGNIYISLHNNLHSKLAQIKKYNWLNKQLIQGCHKNMEILNNKKLVFESKIVNCDEDVFKHIHADYGMIQIDARIDAFDEDSVYEFKCVDNISIDHKLQLIIYSWMWRNSTSYQKHGDKEFKLLNIRSGELLLLKNEYYKITQIIELVLTNKFNKKIILSDAEFIDNVLKSEAKLKRIVT